MSTILVDNLTGKTSAGSITVTSEGGAATQSLQQGLAKAWINFDGTGTIAARDSLNVSGLVDDAVGLYSIGLSNSMGNSNYTLSVASQQNSTNAADAYVRYSPAPSTSSFTVEYVLAGTSRYDNSLFYSNIHGDLA